MTVRALRALLATMPQDLPVVFEFEACGEVTRVEQLKPGDREGTWPPEKDKGAVILRGAQ